VHYAPERERAIKLIKMYSLKLRALQSGGFLRTVSIMSLISDRLEEWIIVALFLKTTGTDANKVHKTKAFAGQEVPFVFLTVSVTRKRPYVCLTVSKRSKFSVNIILYSV
jgi:hypothetical protein